MKSLLILDEDDAHASKLARFCKEIGFNAVRAASLSDAAATIRSEGLAAAFIDIHFGHERAGLELLKGDGLSEIDAVFMSEQDDPALANELIRKGANYVFCKPFNPEMLGPLLKDIQSEFQSETQDDKEELPGAVDQFGYLRGSSKSMRKLYRQLRKVAATDASLMIVGESGTGKELVAQTVHAFSSRSDGPYIAFNSAAMAENLAESELFGHEKGSFSGAHARHKGFFERANGGTLFLDEITEMDINLQAKILRVIETRKLRRLGSEEDIDIDVRFLSATNRSPEQCVEEETLREDLYFRLAQFPLLVPPLRQRGGDICGLAQYFLNALNVKHETDIHFSSEALKYIESKSWPGNVRELKHYVERAYILSESTIELAVLQDADEKLAMSQPPSVTAANTQATDGTLTIETGTPLEDMEKKLILASLKANEGDKKLTAKELGVSLKTLYNRLKDYDPEA